LYDSIIKDYHHFLDTHPAPVKPLLNGEEIMELLNLKPGKQVGEVLDKLHEAQINKEVQYKDEAIAFIKNF
jgi:tRNA nucleotidyltransferase/poly(A) polymerase